MSHEVVLDAVRREVTGKKVRALRREGKLPAVIYGAGVEPTSILLDLRETAKALRTATSATLITINVEGETHTALLRERQYDRLRQELSHLDFLAVAMNVLLRAAVPLRLVGTAPAIKDFGAMVMQETESLEVEALPRNLPESIDVDVSALRELGSNVTVADLKLGDDVQILDEPDVVIAVAIAMSQGEEEEEEEDEFGEMAEPEVIERGKRDEDEEDED